MSLDRKTRRKAARAFRPEVEGQRLEERVVMTQTSLSLAQFLLTHPQVGYAYRFNNPRFVQGKAAHAQPFPFGSQYNRGVIDVQTAHGGQSVVIAQPDGSRFRVSLTLADNQYDGLLSAETGSTGNILTTTTATPVAGAVIQPQGTIRAYPMPGGKVGIIVDGSTQRMQVTIDPLPFAQRKNFAHSFAYAEASRSHVLNIGSFQVTSGKIAAILGYHSADLSGPLSVGGTAPVDRIAFDALLPGAAIGVGGNLNTLDVYNNVTLTAGPGISVGGDLNLFNVGQSVVLANGASIRIGRFAGLTPQPPKGTGSGSNVLSLNASQIGTGATFLTPSVSALIQGDLTIGPGSVLNIVSGIANSSVTGTGTGASPSPFTVNGKLNVASLNQQIFTQIPNVVINNQFAPTVNFVARNGVVQSGVVILPPS